MLVLEGMSCKQKIQKQRRKVFVLKDGYMMALWCVTCCITVRCKVTVIPKKSLWGVVQSNSFDIDQMLTWIYNRFDRWISLLHLNYQTQQL